MKKIVEIKKELLNEIKNIKDKAIKIKLQEVSKYLIELNKNDKVTSEHLIDLLQYYDLIAEIQNNNGKV